MKRTYKAFALCAMVALPIGMVTAGQIGSQAAATEVKAEEVKTQTVKLTITGMT